MKAKFPPEFIQQVATYLTLQDCSNSLYVCKLWFHIFQRSIYRKVYIYSDNQLQKLLESLTQSFELYQNSYHNGLMIREIHLVKEKNTLLDPRNQEPKRHVHLSQKTFDLLAKLCPELEILNFDISQWQHIKLNSSASSWKHMRQCAPISYMNFNAQFLTTFNGSKLSHLHLSHQPEKLDELVGSLKYVSSLESLTLEMNYNENDAVSLPFTKCLQQMHALLPRLNSFNFIRTKTPHQESSASSQDPHFLSAFKQPCHNLQALSLHGHVDSYKWFDFISSNYPNLQSLSLTQLTTSRFGTKWMWQNALVHMIQSLPSLKSLTLGGKNVPQLFSKGFAVELQKPTCSIDNLYVDFQTYQAIESCQFLLLVQSYGLRQLKFLRLRVWEQIPGWSGVTSNLFHCKQLQTLELSLSKGLMDQFPFTPFLIDHLLGHLPQLERLTLVGANVQVTYNNFVDLDKGSFKLQELELRQSKIENHETVLMYLSSCCPHLDTILLEKCEIEKKRQQQMILPSSTLNTCCIPMPNSTMSKVKLSSFLIYSGTILRNDYIGIELLCENQDQPKIVWCGTNKSKGMQIYPVYSICEDQDKIAELTDLYQTYGSTSSSLLTPMPGNFTPTFGVITIQCKALLSGIALDNLKIPLKHFTI